MEDGPPSFPQNYTCSVVLGDTLGWFKVSHTGLSPTMAALSRAFCYPSPIHTLGPHNPETTVVVSVWANPRSLAATYGISIDFFSCRYLDVSVPCVRLIHLCIQCMMTGYEPRRVSPFGNLRIKACLAAPRSLSQLTTSFIASRCQGIHRTPLVA